MKLLIVTQYFWPENFRINDLAIALKRKGNDVTVLTGIPNYPGGSFFPGYGIFSRDENYNGIIIKRVPIFPRGKSGKFRLILNFISFVVSAGFLSLFYCRGKFDAVFNFGLSPITSALPAVLQKKIKNVPLVLWILDLWPESLSATKAVKSPRILKAVDRIVRFIYKQCDLVLVSSKGYIDSVSSRGVPLEKICFFPNWAESIYRPIDSGQAGLPVSARSIPDGFKLMFAGNIGAAQDFETILDSFEMLKGYKNIHLLVLGKGRKYDWVNEQIKSRDLCRQIHLLGAYPMENMPLFFSIADAMLVSLRSDPIFSLTIPGKMQTYLACGKPIIGALDGEGARLIRDSRAGISCPSSRPKDLSEAILQMYKTPIEERRQMGFNARGYYENNYDRDKLIEYLIETMHDRFYKGAKIRKDLR